MKRLDALIKDVYSVLVCPQFFLWLIGIFVRSGPEMVPQIKYFRKFPTELNNQGLK